MVYFNLIQCIGCQVLCRLLQITDSRCILILLDQFIQSLPGQNDLALQQSDSL